jgi:hypothetical protein
VIYIDLYFEDHLPGKAIGKSIKKALPISQKSFEDIADTISQN